MCVCVCVCVCMVFLYNLFIPIAYLSINGGRFVDLVIKKGCVKTYI